MYFVGIFWAGASRGFSSKLGMVVLGSPLFVGCGSDLMCSWRGVVSICLRCFRRARFGGVR